MPAAAVIRGGSALSGMIGRKGFVGGFLFFMETVYPRGERQKNAISYENKSPKFYIVKK